VVEKVQVGGGGGEGLGGAPVERGKGQRGGWKGRVRGSSGWLNMYKWVGEKARAVAARLWQGVEGISGWGVGGRELAAHGGKLRVGENSGREAATAAGVRCE
jgi:hypothetical protein